MMIMVSGPVSAGGKEEERENVDALSRAAAALLKKGHIPVVGVHAARPVVEAAAVADEYEAIMRISLALAERCDAVLMVGDSDGAGREREVFERAGRPVYFSPDDIPEKEADR